MPIIQHLIHEIYVGHLVYAPQSSRALISDSYISERTKKKRQPSHPTQHRPAPSEPLDEEDELAEVYLYNPYEAGWLDHGRLRVPKWRKWLEFTSFGLLLCLFVATLTCELPSLNRHPKLTVSQESEQLYAGRNRVHHLHRGIHAGRICCNAGAWMDR